jgi:hypothetical protein
MTNKHIDLERAVKLVNKRSTTVDDLCKFIYEDIKTYQEEQELYYLEQLRFEFEGSERVIEEDCASKQAEEIGRKIERDTKLFSIAYAKNSVDVVLDAINQEQFKTKLGPQNLLILLTTLQEINEEI